jgi:hypothetical protein
VRVEAVGVHLLQVSARACVREGGGGQQGQGRYQEHHTKLMHNYSFTARTHALLNTSTSLTHLQSLEPEPSLVGAHTSAASICSVHM